MCSGANFVTKVSNAFIELLGYSVWHSVPLRSLMMPILRVSARVVLRNNEKKAIVKKKKFVFIISVSVQKMKNIKNKLKVRGFKFSKSKFDFFVNGFVFLKEAFC
jgi:hypothetical protein